MISATMLTGYICANEENVFDPANAAANDFLIKSSGNFSPALSAVIQANYFVWTAESGIREEFFKNDEISINNLMKFVSSGGAEWAILSISGAIEEGEFVKFFSFLKDLFVICSSKNKGENEFYNDIIGAFDNMI